MVEVVPAGPRARFSRASTGGSSAAALDLSETEIREVQRVLIERRLLTGEADGVLGPQTREALTTFQRQQGIQITGVIDTHTVDALGLSSRISQSSTTSQGQTGTQQTQQQPASAQQNTTGQGSGQASAPTPQNQNQSTTGQAAARPKGRHKGRHKERHSSSRLLSRTRRHLLSRTRTRPDRPRRKTSPRSVKAAIRQPPTRTCSSPDRARHPQPQAKPQARPTRSRRLKTPARIRPVNNQTTNSKAPLRRGFSLDFNFRLIRHLTMLGRMDAVASRGNSVRKVECSGLQFASVLHIVATTDRGV